MTHEYDESPLIATRYSRIAARLVNSIHRHLSTIIYVTIALAAFSVLDVLGVLHIIGLSSDYVHDIIVTIVLLVLLGILSLVLLYIIRARKILELWHDMFESSSLKTSISILMKNKSKKEALYAIAESIDEINPYMQRYIENNDIDRFIDNKIEDLRFDILIDRSNADEKLRRILEDYGSIIVKIVEKADEHTINKFHEQLLRYNRMTDNKIGLGIIIADEIKPITIGKHKAIDRLLLVEKSKV